MDTDAETIWEAPSSEALAQFELEKGISNRHHRNFKPAVFRQFRAAAHNYFALLGQTLRIPLYPLNFVGKFLPCGFPFP